MELLERVKSKCNCLSGIKEEEYNDLWAGFLRFLSNITCWDIHGGTLLKECRVHSISLTRPLCSYDCIQVQPYWKNIDLDTVSIELRQYTSFGMNVIPLDSNYFNYDDISDKFYINLKNQIDICNQCNKDCEENVLVFKYEAGYDLNSPEWLDLICHYMSAYVAISNDCINVNDCYSANKIAIGARLKKKTVDTINYEWEVDESSKEIFFNKLMQNFYVDFLSRYSLCGRDLELRYNLYIGKDGSHK